MTSFQRCLCFVLAIWVCVVQIQLITIQGTSREQAKKIVNLSDQVAGLRGDVDTQRKHTDDLAGAVETLAKFDTVIQKGFNDLDYATSVLTDTIKQYMESSKQ